MNQRLPKTLQAGFTLIEIMVVVVILGLLVGIVGPNVMKQLFKAEEDTARAQIRQIDGAIKLYYMNEHKIPTMEELTEKDDSGMAELQDFSNMDPWGNPYEIREGDTSTEWVVVCYGKDGSEGTDDDIRSDDVKKEDG